jgi:hypothetical protein
LSYDGARYNFNTRQVDRAGAEAKYVWYVIDVWQKLKVRSRVRPRDVACGVFVCSIFWGGRMELVNES